MPRRCPFCLAGIFAFAFLSSPFIRNCAAQDPKPVVVARVTEAEIKSGMRVVGTVNPLKRSTIGSAVDGRVKTVPVNSGDRVSKGDPLTNLRTKTLEIELKAAKAELKLAKQQLQELENGSRQEDKDEAKANWMSARASYRSAKSNLERVKTLHITNAASDAELDAAIEKEEAAKFAVAASEALFKKLDEGPRKESIAQAEAQVELQNQKVLLISDRITKCSIVAPFDGFIAAEFTEEGAWIKQGDPVIELIQMSEVEIEAPVTADIAVNLQKGIVVRVEFPELPNQLLTGTIERIVPSSASRARTFPVYIKLKNQFRNGIPMLLAGMLARVDFPAGRTKKLPLVPKDALVLNGKQRSVFVIDSVDGSTVVRKVDVELGVALEDRIQVIGDLKKDQQVVVVGNERLVANSPVKVVQQVESTEIRE